MPRAKTGLVNKPATTSSDQPKYATVEQVEQLNKSIAGLMDFVKSAINTPKAPATPEEVKHEAEVVKASPNKDIVNPEWEEAAQEIIGEALDHCEVNHIRSGGTIFTVVIKPEFSNAPKEYMERMKEDRRSREIGNEGFVGVENWCKLVKANISRPRTV